MSALVVPDSLPAALLARRPDVVQAERAVRRGDRAHRRRRRGAASDDHHHRLVRQSGRRARRTSSARRRASIRRSPASRFPLFTTRRLANAVGGGARARRAGARVVRGRALNALREANDALAGVRTARDQAVAQATQANALRQALELATSRYQAGLASYLDVLDAQRSLFDAELALSQAQLGELRPRCSCTRRWVEAGDSSRAGPYSRYLLFRGASHGPSHQHIDAAHVHADPLTQRVTALEARVAALEAVLKIGSGGDVTLKATSTISLDATNGIMCKSGSTLSIEAGTGIMAKAGTTLDLLGGTNTTIKGFAALSASAGSTMTLKGGIININ